MKKMHNWFWIYRKQYAIHQIFDQEVSAPDFSIFMRTKISSKRSVFYFLQKKKNYTYPCCYFRQGPCSVPFSILSTIYKFKNKRLLFCWHKTSLIPAKSIRLIRYVNSDVRVETVGAHLHCEDAAVSLIKVTLYADNVGLQTIQIINRSDCH